MTEKAAPILMFSSTLLFVGLATPSQAPDTSLRLYQSNGSSEVRLVDANGNIAHKWPTQFVPNGTDFQEDGTLLRGVITPTGNGIQRLALDGTVLWDYRSEPRWYTHHDIEPLPGGNVLMIARETKTAAQAIAAGRNPAFISGGTFLIDSLIEIKPTGPTTGQIVWEWHVLDHLIQDFDNTKPNFGAVGEHPELIDINYPPEIPIGNEFNHANGIDYDPIHEWIVISSPRQDEIWIIDHSTTRAQARGHTGGRWGKGGDLLYRWGNPEAYRAGPASAKLLGFQHAPQFVLPGYPGAGNITMFNNFATPTSSSAVEIELPVNAEGVFVLGKNGRYGPTEPAWSYSAPALFSPILSSAERLPNGNTLICSGRQNWIFEVTPAGQVVWEHYGAGHIFQSHHTTRTLWANRSTVSAAGGGTTKLNLIAGSTAANEQYFVLCSASGTSPGTSLLGVTVPLNADLLFNASLTYPNTPLFVQTFGGLSTSGKGGASFELPPNALPPGFRLDFAYIRLLLAPFGITAASNPVPLVTL